MSLLRYRSLVVGVLLLYSQAQAANVPLQNMNEADVKNFAGDMSTDFLHTSVSGAGTLGQVFGFELGLFGGQTNTPHINSLAHEVDPSANVGKLPNAGILGVLSVPLGITGEVSLLPKVGSSDFKFSTMGIAAKWTPTETLLQLPVDLAVKLSLSKASLDVSQTVQNVPFHYKYDGMDTALTFLVSKNFVIVEPYFGLGLVNATGDLSYSGSTNIFDTTYTTASSASVKRTGTLWMLGTEVKLLIFKVGVEYTNMLNTSRYTGKLSFYF